MKANLLAPEGDDDRVFAIDLEPSASHRDLECPRIERLDEAVSQLVIHLEEAAYNGVTQLLFYDDGVRGALRFVGPIRAHSSNSARAVRGPITQIFQPRPDHG